MKKTKKHQEQRYICLFKNLANKKSQINYIAQKKKMQRSACSRLTTDAKGIYFKRLRVTPQVPFVADCDIFPSCHALENLLVRHLASSEDRASKSRILFADDMRYQLLRELFQQTAALFH